MKLVHFESGLGNQMLNYAEYLAIQHANPQDDCYIEKVIYEYPDVSKVICQWNGYELDRIFSLKLPDIKDLFQAEEWDQIVQEIGQSRFWEKGWNYPEGILPVLKEHGIVLENECIPFAPNRQTRFEKRVNYLKNANPFSARLKLLIKKHGGDKYKYARAIPEKLFMTTERSIYVGQTLGFLYQGNDIEKIDAKLRDTFTFPQIIDKKNEKCWNEIRTCNAVSIHARRGDDLSNQRVYYKSGYFKRAVSYIKSNVEKPVFYIFGDPGATEWCKENLYVFGLGVHDNILFVDWNKGLDSYRDMQLMSCCKHNIFTDSTFSWWAAYLNSYPNKITCSSNYAINTTDHF